MIKRKTVSARIFFAGTFAAFASIAQAGEENLAFVMTVIEDQAHGDQLIQGDYDEAILKLVAQKDKHGFSASNNLCVAYTKTNKLPEAERACSQALKRSKTTYGSWYDSAKKTDYAVALSNRGVIRALVGDTEGARRDFKRAMTFTQDVTAPADNLAVLDAKSTETVSALQ